ncbi:unnamed protein product [Citrullus colocynthis]|uniref:Uncharacterized protein n=1 Tax=Citrullus colocynthis TaxID=252529 RepID=A0ABP0Y614_9ROSI
MIRKSFLAFYFKFSETPLEFGKRWSVTVRVRFISALASRVFAVRFHTTIFNLPLFLFLLVFLFSWF